MFACAVIIFLAITELFRWSLKFNHAFSLLLQVEIEGIMRLEN